jgi:peptidoglycan lytic transglycosylase
MFSLRRLSVPRALPKKTPISGVVLFSLLAQSCTTVSGLSHIGDPAVELPQGQNKITPNGANIQKASFEPVSRKKSSRPAAKRALYGTASWYGPGFHGKKTASGEIYDQNKLTAAHKTVPLGSKARVTNLDNGNSVEVEINDRGPFVEGRIIDLSRAAAGVLGLVESGTAPVRVELITDPTVSRAANDR